MSAAPLDTIVVGAGISGLAYAHARLRAGGECLVLEGASRAGGLVHTASEHGYRYESGPEAVPAARHVRALCAELELPLHATPPAAAKRYLQLDGKLVAVPGALDDLATTRIVSFGAKLRLMAEATCARDEALDGSIADFARHRFGQETLERVVDPLVAGIHAGDPEQLSLRACFPEVARMVEEHGSITAAMKARARAKEPGTSGAALGGGLLKPAGGMQSLTDALARALGPRLRLESAVSAVERAGDAFVVREKSGTAHRAARVVLALPLAAARTLLGGPAPEATAALASMTTENLVSVVHAYRRADVGHALDGFGYLVPKSAGGLVLGTLFSSTVDPSTAPAEHVLLRSLLGGARHPGAVELSDAELSSRIADECRGPLDLQGAPVFLRLARWPAVIPRYDLEHPSRIARLAEALPSGLHVLGNFTRGVGLEKLIAEARALAGAAAPELA